MTEKSTSRGDYAKQIFSLPFTFLKSIFYQPARTIRSIYAIAIGSVMTFPGNRQNIVHIRMHESIINYTFPSTAIGGQ